VPRKTGDDLGPINKPQQEQRKTGFNIDMKS